MTVRPEAEELTIKTGGKTLGGWLDFRAERGVERCASSLVIDITERYPNEISAAIVEPGSPCEVSLGKDKILTGYIDRYQPGVGPNDHRVALICRSKTEDLVDCAVDVASVGWSISAATLGAAARKICETYKIDVSLPDGDVTLDTDYPFTVMAGMTCWQLIEQIARAAQVLVWDDAEGRLVLSKVGTKRAGSALMEGRNIESVQSLFSMDERYSDYLIAYSTNVAGTDGHNNYLIGKGVVQDKEVKRTRLWMIPLESVSGDLNWARQRAEWERARRYGRSRQTMIAVTGWRDGQGALWTPNTIVHIEAASQKLKEDWVIAEVSYVRSAGSGTQAVLRCMPKDGLIPAPFHPLQPISLNS